MPAHSTPRRIFISAGEASGDLHAANLVKAMRQLDPNLNFFGMGGESMRQAGVDVIVDAKEVALIGVFEILAHLPKIFRALAKLRTAMENGAELAIFIDCPGINMRLARHAKKLKLPAIYYIPPQIWAWRRGRVKTIAKRLSKVLLIFPFEPEIYHPYRVANEYVGHPLLDEIKLEFTQAESRRYFQLPQDRKIIALLPGSRLGEIKRLLPEMLKAAEQIQKHYQDAIFILPLASSLKLEQLQPYLSASKINVKIITDHKHDALKLCNVAIVTSGTATLEVGLLSIPMVVIYKVTFLTYCLGRLLIHVPYVSLCNIIAGKEVVKELIQHQANPQVITEEVLKILEDQSYRENMLQELKSIKEKTGQPGVSLHAAQAALELLNFK